MDMGPTYLKAGMVSQMDLKAFGRRTEQFNSMAAGPGLVGR
jgi:hypothetical protein